jgi:hypothetical protein
VRATAERLHAALVDLPVVIDGVACRTRAVAVPSYGGPRPSSVVTLTGGGRRGDGEHVGWTDDAHTAFASALPRVPRGSWRLGDFVRALAARLDAPYDRAAVEMAAVDLALRQRTTTLAALAGATPRLIRHVVSFARTPDPAAEAARHAGAELKVDADPAWAAATWEALARADRVAVVDWKGTGDADAYAHALRSFPDALHEDPAAPYPDGVARRLVLDAPVTTPRALADVAPAWCNLKPSRMGSLLDVIALAADCARRGIGVYVGGMFEVDVGRRQLRDLAAILCPDGPNDLAPITVGRS